MNKLGIICIMLILFSVSLAFSLDVGVDVRTFDPKPLLEDAWNKLKNGWVVKEGDSVLYFGNTIKYEIAVKKNNPSDWYVFYRAPEDKKAFHEFYSDVVKHYVKGAGTLIPSASGSESEIETAFTIYDMDGRAYAIYTKYSETQGFRGFGITPSKPLNDKLTITEISEKLKGKKILNLDSFDPKDWFVSNAYIHKNLILEKASIDIVLTKESLSDGWYFKFSVILTSDAYFLPVRIEWSDAKIEKTNLISGVVDLSGTPYLLYELEKADASLYIGASIKLLSGHFWVDDTDAFPEGVSFKIIIGSK